MNAGSRVDHNRFCLNEGWQAVRDARGRRVGHHVTYELVLGDGRILRTRISRPVNTKTYGPGLWKAILRDQLEVTEEEFWACVKDRRLPDRGQSGAATPPGALPASLVHLLIHDARVPEDEVATMTVDAALSVLADYWSQPKPE